MLHVQVVASAEVCDRVVDCLKVDPAVVDLVLVRGAAVAGAGDLLAFHVAREGADVVVRRLHELGVDRVGSISISEPLAVMSAAADAAEASAPGHPSDGVVWAQVESQARRSAAGSWSFFVFLTIACLIAGVGRYLDQPILIIGAMVVGPEFAPVAAICLAIARRRPGLAGPALGTLTAGFGVALVVSWAVWSVAHVLGGLDTVQATTGDLTEFIVKPDIWSFVVALLAGCVGVLSLTASQSSALVGVFISITTVPAVATAGLTLAVGAWGEAAASGLQLAINLAGLLLAGTVTLAVQSLLWRRLAGRRRSAGA